MANQICWICASHTWRGPVVLRSVIQTLARLRCRFKHPIQRLHAGNIKRDSWTHTKLTPALTSNADTDLSSVVAVMRNIAPQNHPLPQHTTDTLPSPCSTRRATLHVSLCAGQSSSWHCNRIVMVLFVVANGLIWWIAESVFMRSAWRQHSKGRGLS